MHDAIGNHGGGRRVVSVRVGIDLKVLVRTSHSGERREGTRKCKGLRVPMLIWEMWVVTRGAGHLARRGLGVVYRRHSDRRKKYRTM